MPLSGKHYYECPGVSFAAGGGTVWRPALAAAVDAAGGAWAVAESAADGSRFVVAVNDRTHPSLPRNAAVHTACAAVAGCTWLGADWTVLVAWVAAHYGAVRAARLLGQTVGGE